jgi:hypothetical protein
LVDLIDHSAVTQRGNNGISGVFGVYFSRFQVYVRRGGGLIGGINPGEVFKLASASYLIE